MVTEATVIESPETIDTIVHKHNVEPGAVIPILQEIQKTYGYVPPVAIQRVAEHMSIPAAEIYGIVTFYRQFRTQPLGKNLVKVCHGTACHLGASEVVAEALSQATGAGEGKTSSDGLFTVERVTCLGCCSLAPCIMVNNEIHGRLTPESIDKLVAEMRKQETPLRPNR
jgi:NADH-quinone oxidoreductase subunit E